jgi:predicted dehydrogenase
VHILIIGGGSIGERHLRSFLRHEGVACSLAEPAEARRRELEVAYAIRQSHASWEEADFSRIDGAVICAPTDLHVTLLHRLIDAGVDTLCEKPLSTNLKEIPELLQKVEASSTTTAVAFCFRHHPAIEEMKQRIDSGDLGTIHAAHYYGGQYWPEARTQWPPAYAMSRETGGGAIPDHMVHQINILEWLMGPVASVSAFQRHLSLSDIPTEDFGTTTLRFQRGSVAVLTLCLFKFDPLTYIQVVGDAGTAAYDYLEESMQTFTRKAKKWERGAERCPNRDHMFYLQAGHFLRCLRNEATPRCTVAEAARTLDVVQAALKSSDGNGAFIPVP